MVQNIAIISLDRGVSYEVAKLVANELEMHFIDTIDLFEFDNKPRTLSDMLKQFGIRYFRQKEKGTLKYVSGFSNSVINLESGMAGFKGNFDTVKENCLLIYLKHDKNNLLKKFKDKSYDTGTLKRFYCISESVLIKRDMKLTNNADIVIKVNNQSPLKIASEVIRNIKSFYGV